MSANKNITENQLSNIFKNTRKNPSKVKLEDLNKYSEASSSRLNEVELIADNNLLSATQQAMNKLSPWIEATGHDIERKLQDRPSFDLLSWLKPGLVAASFVTTFLFLNPEMTETTQHQQLTDSIINSSFDGVQPKQDVINDASFDKNIDVISNSSFG